MASDLINALQNLVHQRLWMLVPPVSYKGVEIIELRIEQLLAQIENQ